MRPMARVRDFDQAVVFDDLRAPVRFRVGERESPTEPLTDITSTIYLFSAGLFILTTDPPHFPWIITSLLVHTVPPFKPNLSPLSSTGCAQTAVFS